MTAAIVKPAVCVFCGARDEVDPIHLSMGKRVGTMMAEAGMRLVFGGGDCGMMGQVSTAAMRAGGEVTGVFPDHLKSFEIQHQGITEMIVVGSMHERKMRMFELSDAFAILPGGFGTMDEMFEILTWRQIGLHDKPVIIFNHEGYWDPLLKMLDHMMDAGFVRPANREFIEVVHSPESLIQSLSQRFAKKSVNSSSNSVDKT